jgi:hypothetical protein
MRVIGSSPLGPRKNAVTRGLRDPVARYSEILQLVIIEVLKNPDGLAAIAKPGEAPAATRDPPHESAGRVVSGHQCQNRECDHLSFSFH